ncbi:hypothetical protein [Allopontixanthobacter sp.]|uniref:hypothetical protein n=1 Tax=Allopontixanthobacter sp. TaxID=2906452 RepID=UPI002AB8F4B5|nr:hypothetical protein [Allopontixanthobacter sp.]MDZ4306887.1 hypothetical protein [Allopontixanthobacter sp.]
MRAMRRLRQRLSAGALLLAIGTGAIAQPVEVSDLSNQEASDLSYQVVEGFNINAFVRDGPVAAHLLLRSGADPRILVAFPAGNSGVGLWFERLDTPAEWRLEESPKPISLKDDKGRLLHGVRATATVAAKRLTIKQAVLSNVRFLRDYQSVGTFPAAVSAPMSVSSDRVVFARDRIDGAPGYLLSVRVLDGHLENDALVADADGKIRLEITAASGETPLNGFTEAELLNDRAAEDPAGRNALRFLSYREKFLAGSWRFNTYFGRDTLMSVRLLMPALQPQAIEAGLSSVLANLNAAGEVAHEEGLSEFALVDRRKRGLDVSDAAVLDYAMIDDDFMLAPVMAAYLLDSAEADAARAYLARAVSGDAQSGSHERVGPALVRNLRFVLDQARPFADAPAITNLISLKPGRKTGQWRDSEEGIGRGRYAYDVNAVFVPAALDAAQRLLTSGLLDPYLSDADRAIFSDAGRMAEIWSGRAPALFRVSMPVADAKAAINSYAAIRGIPAGPALAALHGEPLAFHAISLDEHGSPVPIIHSDEGFALLFGRPSPAELDVHLSAMMRPFPAGLMTDIGLLVANPALTEPEVQARFTPAAYHGTVVWSWQQAMVAAGLERQLARTDLPAATRARLEDAQAKLWSVILSVRELANSELWSWAYENDRYQVVPFGAGTDDVDESNAAQLWSTVYLAVQPPRTTPP